MTPLSVYIIILSKIKATLVNTDPFKEGD